MSLDEELRATLAREAEARAVPTPDVAGLVRGGRARRRRRTTTRLAVAGLAAAVVAVTAFNVGALDLRSDGELASEPSPSPRAELETLSEDGRATLEPGTYRMFVGKDAAGARVDVDVTVDGPGWKHGDFPVVSDEHDTTYAGFGVYQPWALASGDGCETGPTLGPLPRTPSGLARQLADLPRSTVLQQPGRTSVAGIPAVHLRLRIQVACPGYYRVAHAAGGTRGITYSSVALEAPDVVIDFWVLDVDGAVVVIDEWHNLDAPAELAARARDARRSVTFVAGG